MVHANFTFLNNLCVFSQLPFFFKVDQFIVINNKLIEKEQDKF